MPIKTKTRSSKGPPKTEPAPSSSTAQKVSLAPQSSNPPKVFILPKDASTDARIVTLAHPRTSVPTRYLCCPHNGFYEFTKVGAPRTTPRSWLLAPGNSSTGQEKTQKKSSAIKKSKDSLETGYVTKAADIFIATQLDPLFLMLPVLAPPPSVRSSEPKKRMFLASDDYLDALTAASPHFQTLLRKDSTRKLLETRMAAVCDSVDAGDMMYRLSEDKLHSELLSKAQRIVDGGLPTSMEEKLIRKALEVPMLSLKRGESSLHELTEEESNRSGAATPATATDSLDSQTTVSSNDTIATNASFASTAATSSSESEEAAPKPLSTAPAPIAAPAGVPELLRLRTAFNFITSSYVPSHLTTALSTADSAKFADLDTHLAHLSTLRHAALAARSLGDYSRKRSLNEDEEAGEGRAEKKRKKEEEEKRKKAGESRGVRDLKKVNVQGMKKMSDFFKKK